MIWPPRRLPPPVLPAITLETPRLVIRPPAIDDHPQWSEVRERNQAYLEPYEPSWPDQCLSRDFFLRRLKRQAQDWQQDRSYSFLLFKKEAATLIGGVNINNISRGASQFGTLGYWLAQNEQGRGYMNEALRAIIDFGFTDLKLHRFNAGCLAHNERSIRLLLRLGFKEEGFAEKYVQINGQWQDHRLFGLPAENWLASISSAAG